MDHLPTREGVLVCKAVVRAIRGEQVHQPRQIPCIDGCIVPAGIGIGIGVDVGAGLNLDFSALLVAYDTNACVNAASSLSQLSQGPWGDSIAKGWACAAFVSYTSFALFCHRGM